MSKGAFLALVGTALALVLAAVGCGGGGDSTTTVTKAQFVKQVNALCLEREKERLNAVQSIISGLKPGAQLSDSRQAKMVTTIIVPSYTKMIANVKSLEAPEGDNAEIEKIVKAMEQALKKVEADPRQAVFSVVMFEQANGLATKYGLKSCVI